jgi:hypothetical protein
MIKDLGLMEGGLMGRADNKTVLRVVGQERWKKR